MRFRYFFNSGVSTLIPSHYSFKTDIYRKPHLHNRSGLSSQIKKVGKGKETIGKDEKNPDKAAHENKTGHVNGVSMCRRK